MKILLKRIFKDKVKKRKPHQGGRNSRDLLYRIVTIANDNVFLRNTKRIDVIHSYYSNDIYVKLCMLLN